MKDKDKTMKEKTRKKGQSLMPTRKRHERLRQDHERENEGKKTVFENHKEKT